jgi:hypothetical protein
MAIRPLLLCLVLPLLACSRGDMSLVTLDPGSLGSGMVAHYTGEGNLLGRLDDVSGNGHHGVLSGVSQVDGRFGMALRFQLGNFASVPNFPQATESYTVALWARPEAGDFGDTFCTLASTEAVFVGGWEMNVRLSAADNRYHFGYPFGGDAGYEYVYVDNLWVKPGVWTHLAAVVDDEARRLRLYVDGVLVDDQPATTLIHPGSTTLYLGRWVDSDRFYAGDLDDIVIYRRALVPEEIQALFRAQAPNPI